MTVANAQIELNIQAFSQNGQMSAAIENGGGQHSATPVRRENTTASIAAVAADGLAKFHPAGVSDPPAAPYFFREDDEGTMVLIGEPMSGDMVQTGSENDDPGTCAAPASVKALDTRKHSVGDCSTSPTAGVRSKFGPQRRRSTNAIIEAMKIGAVLNPLEDSEDLEEEE